MQAASGLVRRWSWGEREREREREQKSVSKQIKAGGEKETKRGFRKYKYG